MPIIFKNRHEEPIHIDTNENILIKEHKDLLSIRTQVTDFVEFFNYCRYNYGYNIRPHNINKSYMKNYNELLYLNQYNTENRSIHITEKNRDNGKIFTTEEIHRILPDEKKDIYFRRESVYSRLLIKSVDNDQEIILIGRPDKLSRKGENIIIDEDKPGNWHNYMNYPYGSYVLQASIYAYSKFSLEFRPTINKVGKYDNRDVKDDSYENSIDDAWNTASVSNVLDNILGRKYDYDMGGKDFFSIPHKKKILKISIRDPGFPDSIEDNTVTMVDLECNSKIREYITENLKRFVNILSTVINKNSKDSLLECRLCKYKGYCPMMKFLYALKN